MDQTTLIVALMALSGLGLIVLLVIYFSGQSGGGQVRSLMRGQRSPDASRRFGDGQRGDGTNLYETAKDSQVQRKVTSRLTLRKKLMYAQWKWCSPILFNVLQITITLIAFILTRQTFGIVIQIISLVTGPLFMNWLLNMGIERRFKAFDVDYPQMISSLVGLLKTGMNPIQALEAASKGLEEGSLCRAEVELMIERLRFGVSEDKSIGAFGEDIYHPEIELFVQALLLSRRVGGNLSDTLERLAKQVRKRQYFRASAKASISMQRGSIWFIICVLVFLEVYIYIMYPQAINDSIQDPMGWQVWQGAILVILLGMFWIRQVTKIRI